MCLQLKDLGCDEREESVTVRVNVSIIWQRGWSGRRGASALSDDWNGQALEGVAGLSATRRVGGRKRSNPKPRLRIIYHNSRIEHDPRIWIQQGSHRSHTKLDLMLSIVLFEVGVAPCALDPLRVPSLHPSVALSTHCLSTSVAICGLIVARRVSIYPGVSCACAIFLERLSATSPGK